MIDVTTETPTEVSTETPTLPGKEILEEMPRNRTLSLVGDSLPIQLLDLEGGVDSVPHDEFVQQLEQRTKQTPTSEEAWKIIMIAAFRGDTGTLVHATSGETLSTLFSSDSPKSMQEGDFIVVDSSSAGRLSIDREPWNPEFWRKVNGRFKRISLKPGVRPATEQEDDWLAMRLSDSMSPHAAHDTLPA